ncbi:GIY-YIG nuclease family protein [Desulfospira joergensenii]|uniref:GIY-YIG nuclease family protein n=1 Tax=Desulfospira joergensenii TaxID=53329 RepID=UPI0003B3DD30|nr:GIY-YIG nuclease family protein [Desulfospira joergensenii]
MEDLSRKGTYIIVLHFDRARTIDVGKLGPVQFRKGYYAYVGSAFGPGGMKSRIRHHILPKKRCHWHLDYLDTAAKEIWVSEPGARLEHEWALSLGRTSSGRIPGFGSSDCACDSHLLYFKNPKEMDKARKSLSLKKHQPDRFL